MLRRRIGDDRAPCEVNDEVVTVLVAKIGHGVTCIDGRGNGASRALFVADFALRRRRAGLVDEGGATPQLAAPAPKALGQGPAK